MTDVAFHVPALFDYAATVAWATSGAVVAIRKRFDITGVFVIALLSSIGGGLVRDALFLQRTPSFILDPVYLPLIAGATMLMSLFTARLADVVRSDAVTKLVDLIDALGTPAYAVIGMQLADHHGIPVFGIVLVGVINGVAGGLLRDVVVRDVPSLLRPGQFTTPMLVLACGLFLLLTKSYGVNSRFAAWTTVGAFFLLRVLAVGFNWRTRSILEEPDGPP